MKNEMLNPLLWDVGDLKESLDSINSVINESMLSSIVQRPDGWSFGMEKWRKS
jgi:hypothetical protein